MPIVIKDFQWEQSEKDVFITVPLKGVKSNRVDIFSTEHYIKVSYPPYIFECFLHAAIHDRKGAAEIGNGVVLFKLEKQEAGLWSDLNHQNIGDKAWTRQQRDEAVKTAHERAEKEQQEKEERKREMDRYGVKEQMRLEDEDRSRIEKLKDNAKTEATQELEEWKEQQKHFAEEQKESERLERIKREKERKEMLSTQKAEAAKNKKNEKVNIFEQQAGEAPVRESAKISIQFTPREFPTPCRESIQAEEDAWLKKQAEARRIAQISDKDLTEEEKNPQWLKDKGDSFFKAGNLLAAINAYSHAIRLDAKLPSIYSNRAACHLKLGNLFKCADDSSKALDLLTPPVPANAVSRVKAHIRRGTAYCKLEAYVEGLMDYDAALKIDPNNEQLKIDANNIRQIIQSSSGR